MKKQIAIFILIFNAALANGQSQGILDSLTHAQQRNNHGTVESTLDALRFTQQAALKYEHGAECEGSCPLGCCDASTGLKYEGAMFILLNRQATIQAQRYQGAARVACTSYNQQAVTVKDCSTEVKSFNHTIPDQSWYDSKGKCRSSAPPECVAISQIPGSGIFGKLAKTPKSEPSFYSTYTANPDGSINIKLKDRTVKLSIDSFKSAQSLTAAGISSDYAHSLLASFQKAQTSMPKINQYANQIYGKQNEQNEDRITKVEEHNEALTKTATYLIDQRLPAADKAGLIKIFNGEPIHSQDADLFKVIAARYKQQDLPLP